MVLGRKSYDILSSYWPTAPEERGAKVFNDATKYVASRGRPTLEWSNSVLIEGDAGEGLAALKKEDGPELQVHGSANLIQTLLRNNLVDEFRLWVFPVVIGTGKRLFADGTIPSGLKLVDSKVSTTGVVIGYLRASRRDPHRIVRVRSHPGDVRGAALLRASQHHSGGEADQTDRSDRRTVQQDHRRQGEKQGCR